MGEDRNHRVLEDMPEDDSELGRSFRERRADVVGLGLVENDRSVDANVRACGNDHDDEPRKQQVFDPAPAGLVAVDRKRPHLIGEQILECDDVDEVRDAHRCDKDHGRETIEEGASVVGDQECEGDVRQRAQDVGKDRE